MYKCIIQRKTSPNQKTEAFTFLHCVFFPSSEKLSLLEGRADSGWAFIARDWAVMGAVMFMT